MSDASANGKMSAWQRWELNSFGDDANGATSRARPQNPVSAQQQQAMLALQQATQEAREFGRQAGYAEGIEQGRKAGREQGAAEIAQQSEQLQQLLHAVRQESARADEAIAHDLLTLSLELARAMLKSALEVRPELVLPLVSHAIRCLPSIDQPAQIALHPDDAQLLREQMPEDMQAQGWRVREDAGMERGGCRIETGSNHIDASLPVRWQRLAAALGRDEKWIV